MYLNLTLIPGIPSPPTRLLRGAIVCRTYGTHKCIYIFTCNIWSYLLWPPLIVSTLLGLQSRFGDNWRQISLNLSGLSPKRDWSTKRVNSAVIKGDRKYYQVLDEQINAAGVACHSDPKRLRTAPSRTTLSYCFGRKHENRLCLHNRVQTLLIGPPKVVLGTFF